MDVISDENNDQPKSVRDIPIIAIAEIYFTSQLINIDLFYYILKIQKHSFLIQF